ncbi:Nucleolar protein 8 [Plecturocebus cupreus]
MKESTRKLLSKIEKTVSFLITVLKYKKRKSNVESAFGHGLKPLNRKSSSHSSSSEVADSASGLADSEGDKESNTMMKNCLRVNLALTDLEQLAGSDLKIPNEDTESDGTETTTQCKFDRGSESPKTPTGLHRGRQCIRPEEIVASLLEGEENTPCIRKPKEQT